MLNKSQKEFMIKFITTFKALFVRIVMIAHASYALHYLITENNLGGVHYVLILPIILVGIEGIVVTTIQPLLDTKRLWPLCAICYLASIIPIIWIVENDAIKEETTTNGTFIGLFTKLGMFLVLIAGRWIISVGDLSQTEVTVLLLALAGHAPDCMALLNVLNKRMLKKKPTTQKTTSQKTTSLITANLNNKILEDENYRLTAVMVVFTLSVFQFAIKSPKVDGGPKKKHDKSKYFSIFCCFPCTNTSSNKRLSTFKDSVVDKAKQLKAFAQEATNMAKDALDKVEDAQKKFEEAKEKAEALVAEGKAKVEEVKGMVDDAKEMLEGARENAEEMIADAKNKAEEEANNQLSNLKGSLLEQAQAAKARALENENVRNVYICSGVLLHLFIALALHSAPVFVVRIIMTMRFDVVNEVHVFFLVKNGTEVIITISQFIHAVRTSESLEKDFNLEDALMKLREIPRELPSVDENGDSNDGNNGNVSAGTSGFSIPV